MKPQKILQVDLSTGQVSVDTVPRDVASKFIASRGVNAYYLYKHMRPGADPLGPENAILFGTGALTGTIAPTSGRVSVTCKSPATNLYVKTNAGGHWGPELKFAGYDYVMVTGSSPKPVYLWIDDDRVEIRDAQAMWGSDTRVSNRLIKEDLGDDDVQIAMIGPAGEKQVMFACVNFSHHHAAGRAGAGAVMGSKNLKAIAVRGTGSVSVENPQLFYEMSARMRRELGEDPSTIRRSIFGTAGGLIGFNELRGLNNRNFQNNYIPYANAISGQHMKEAGYLTGRISCSSCSTACHRYVQNDRGPYGGVHGVGPEFEALVALGAGTDVSDMEAVMKANQICNLLGMDVISAGGVIQWAMESWEKGLLSSDDTDGIDLTWGNARSLVEVVEKIGRREGKIGDLLALGTKRAAEKTGGDSWKWAVQAKGLEQSCVETRSAMGYALAFAVNPRGPDHLMTEAQSEFGITPSQVAVAKRITGDEKYATPYIIDKRAEIVRWHEDVYALTEALGLCVFTSTAAWAFDEFNMTALYNAATGENLTAEQAMEAGRRAVTLERGFNVREGARREHDMLPWRLMNEGVKSGPRAGRSNSAEELRVMIDEYYRLHEWDRDTGIPTTETLEKLGLAELCGDMVAQPAEVRR